MSDVSRDRRFTTSFVRALIAAAAPDDPGLPAIRRVLLTKVSSGDCRTLSALAAALGMPVSTASIHARELERAGLLSRQRTPGDERSLKLELTPVGRERVLLRDRFHPGALDAALAAIGDRRMCELIGGLEELADGALRALPPDASTRRQAEWQSRRASVDPDITPGRRAWDAVREGAGGAATWRQAFAAAAMRVLFALRGTVAPILPEPQMRLLIAVGLSRHSTLTALARELGLPLTTASGQVQVLERQGLLSRSRQAGNERALALALTPAGRAPLALQTHLDPDAVDSALGSIGRARLDALTRALDDTAAAALTALSESLRTRRLDEWEAWRIFNPPNAAVAPPTAASLAPAKT